MKKFRFLTFAMAAMLTFSFASCGPDEPEEAYDGIELNNGEFIEIETSEHDASASYPVHFKIKLQNGNLAIESLTSKANEAGLAAGLIAATDFPTKAVIADIGKVSGIEKITNLPAATEFKDDAPAVEKHGYIIEAHGTYGLNAYQNPNLKDPVSLYVRLWLDEATANGFKVKYKIFVPQR